MSNEEQSKYSLPSWLVVGFTGHRELNNPEKIAEAIQHTLNRLAMRNLRLAGISSVASGADTLFAEEMLQLDCPITIVLPFPCERFKEDFKRHPQEWERAEAIIRNANVDVEVLELSAADQLALRRPYQEQTDIETLKNVAYLEAGTLTVDRAMVLIAVWNGKPANGKGGTAEVVTYAREIGRPLIIIDSVTGAISEERMEHLEDATAYRHKHPRIQEPRKIVEARLKEVDDAAMKDAPRARWFIRVYLLLHLFASSLVASAVAFVMPGWFRILAAIVEISVLFAAILILSKRRKSHHIWLKNRAEAEVCRSFLATWDIRRYPTLSHRPRPPISELQELYTGLRLLRQLDESPLPEFDIVRDVYIGDRVNNQLAYFRRKLRSSTRENVCLNLSMVACTFGAAACAIALLILWYWFHPWGRLERLYPNLCHAAEFFGIFLPLCSTAIGLTIIADESSRRTMRYNEMIELLKESEPLLRACRAWGALARLATDVEEALLQEVLEWRAFVRHTEHLH